MLRIGIIRRRNLDNVGTNKVDAIQSADDRTQLTSRPATSLRSASCRGDYRSNRVSNANQVDGHPRPVILTSWVESVDVNGQINRVVADAVADLLDDSVGSFKALA